MRRLLPLLLQPHHGHSCLHSQSPQLLGITVRLHFSRHAQSLA